MTSRSVSIAFLEPFVGTYEWSWTDDGNAPAIRWELFYEDGMLRQRCTPSPDWCPPLQGQPMVPIDDDWFIPAIVRDGKVWEMVADMVFEFTRANGKAVSFELRDDRDGLLGSGRRVAP